MADTPPTPEQLAAQLIELTRTTLDAEAALNARRIAATLGYLDDVTTPNVHTVSHVRAFLTGGYDGQLDQFTGA